MLQRCDGTGADGAAIGRQTAIQIAVEKLAANAKKVAGRKWWYEEATLTTPEPAEPHGTQEMRRT